MSTTSALTIDPPVSAARGPSTLSDEYARLLRDLHRRVDPLLALMQRNVWPDAELRTLIRFLRTAVLQRASDEEVLLYPAGAATSVADVTAAHARLHVITDQLDRADATSCPLQRLRSLVEELLTALEAHLLDEQAIRAALLDVDSSVAVAPGSTSRGCPQRPIRWLSLSTPGTRSWECGCPSNASCGCERVRPQISTRHRRPTWLQ